MGNSSASARNFAPPPPAGFARRGLADFGETSEYVYAPKSSPSERTRAEDSESDSVTERARLSASSKPDP